ncbi:MAG TPA: hypothetical protein VEH57_00320 [Thermoplasmata archaeon]|nr:hypothetical protein [Thermoplasmata archaeon]
MTLALLSTLVVGLAAARPTVAPTTGGNATPPNDAASGPVVVTISATSAINFVPDSFSVAPGASVEIVVTQMADFEHTFTLSSVVNQTIPSTDTPSEVAAFFNAHPPLVNLSLGTTVGAKFFANFTAPAALGTYEFVCLVHFPSMTGVMAVSSSSGGSSPSSSGTPTTLEWVGIGAVVAVVVIVAVLLAVRRGKPPK